LFEVQRGILEQYHVDDPVTFYNVRDKWTVPTDPYAANVNQPPFYVLANPPTAGGSSAQVPVDDTDEGQQSAEPGRLHIGGQ